MNHLTLRLGYFYEPDIQGMQCYTQIILFNTKTGAVIGQYYYNAWRWGQ